MNIIPVVTVHNPDESLERTIINLKEAGFKNIIVVNIDSDQSLNIYFDAVKQYEGCKVLYNDPNKGRGRALKIAFSYILKNKIQGDGVVTVNGYNQFATRYILACAEKMIQKKNQIIFGSRDFSNREFPISKRIGNFLISTVCRFACGCALSDPLTGMRAIPYEYLEPFLQVKGDMYDYDANLILEAKERKIKISEVKVEDVYLEKKIAAHYKPIFDAIRISSSLIKFVASSIISTVLDQVCYVVVIWVLSLYGTKASVGILVATIFGRAISSFANFYFNKRAVFKSDMPMGKTMGRYYTLAIAQMTISYFLVYFFSNILEITGPLTVTIKILVDLALFFVSFQIQRRWVFHNDCQQGE